MAWRYQTWVAWVPDPDSALGRFMNVWNGRDPDMLDDGSLDGWPGVWSGDGQRRKAPTSAGVRAEDEGGGVAAGGAALLSAPIPLFTEPGSDALGPGMPDHGAHGSLGILNRLAGGLPATTLPRLACHCRNDRVVLAPTKPVPGVLRMIERIAKRLGHQQPICDTNGTVMPLARPVSAVPRRFELPLTRVLPEGALEQWYERLRTRLEDILAEPPRLHTLSLVVDPSRAHQHVPYIARRIDHMPLPDRGDRGLPESLQLLGPDRLMDFRHIGR
ncbi:MAG: hypothetical protein AAF677_03790 [Pseudomonadota bacterium]